MVKYHQYEHSDLRAFAEIDRACFEPMFRYSEGLFRELLAKSSVFTYVEKEDGAIAGFVVAEKMGNGGMRGHIITLDVKHGCRRKGVGAGLLEAAENQLAETGVKEVGVEVWTGNTAGLEFFTKMGYEDVKVTSNYYAKGYDAWVGRKHTNF